MLSPTPFATNQYFPLSQPSPPPSLLEQLTLLQNQISHISQNRKSKLSPPSQFRQRTPKSKQSLSSKHKILNKYPKKIFKQSQSLFIPFTKLSKLEELSQIKEHSKSSRVKNQYGVVRGEVDAKNKVIEEYFGGKQADNDNERENRSVHTNAKLPTSIKIKRSLSQIKPSRLFKKYESPNSKSKLSRVKQLYLPSIKPHQPNFLKKKTPQIPPSPFKLQLSKLSLNKQSITSSRNLESPQNHQKKYSTFKRSKSIKPLKVYNKLNPFKLKTEESRGNGEEIEERLDVLNETLTEIRTLNQIENKTNLLLSQRLNYSSLLLDIQYHNLLNAKIKGSKD